ncbi:MAG TPA: SDR family oxidoreductase [Streptosporangiaceae bacterium]|jgi:NAD(P)-dependent dehydrogenase (short-subunit alcohol dehydrogenase family)
MNALDGRVTVITGAGRGIGREYAKLMAAHGAIVVVNDLGVALNGDGDGEPVASQVVREIRDAGGTALASQHDISRWDEAKSLIQAAVGEFGRLDVLVNNAGIIRDRMFVNMTESDWDSVLNVHLKGTFNTSRHAADLWRANSKAGRDVRACIINTTSVVGLYGAAGQANYAAAKAGIAMLTKVCALELGRYGVRCNAIAPAARTRMTIDTPGASDIVKAPADEAALDVYHPAHNAPLVAALATEKCDVTGEVFGVVGTEVERISGWSTARRVSRPDRWSVEAMIDALPALMAD